MPLAKALGNGRLQSKIYKFINGQVAEPARSTAEPIAAYFKIPLDAIYSEEVATAVAQQLNVNECTEFDGPASQAQTVSHPKFKVPDRPLSRGELETMEKLPESFEMVLDDDAMAPDFPKGRIVRFASGSSAEYGNRVLVRDAAGTLHFRLYAQTQDALWIGLASHSAFIPMKPGSGAQVVAVKTGHYVEGA